MNELMEQVMEIRDQIINDSCSSIVLRMFSSSPESSLIIIFGKNG